MGFPLRWRNGGTEKRSDPHEVALLRGEPPTEGLDSSLSCMACQRGSGGSPRTGLALWVWKRQHVQKLVGGTPHPQPGPGDRDLSSAFWDLSSEPQQSKQDVLSPTDPASLLSSRADTDEASVFTCATRLKILMSQCCGQGARVAETTSFVHGGVPV